jgi:hypothetical protein
VVYESQVCLGGGIIESARRAGDADVRSAECPPNSVEAKAEGGRRKAEGNNL